ncbi:sugar phosphate isomerase/epimerase family protein [Parenemella sanctibonifatiensis]|uniref:Sugar phosphate isomerase n=1 Tax=Parenemella sanctibonifatiensis TaxID=2016505 RepID=A0A255DYX7_9ACTN|nr:sugar phosphate isomerase/epimerase [Parenemella sanctibonifatiensis]OYN84001.1 sugar phosphate isomerase [Parenemella sanctibonifatiensis]
MKLGMLTACLPGWSLAQCADFAVETGYERLEVAVWPKVGGREFEASHLPIADWDGAAKEETQALLERTGLEISAFAYYENNLHQDPAKREEVRTHLKACIDVAQDLGVPYVGTFLGRDNTKSVKENMVEAEKVLPELVDYAGERDIKLIVENCVMEGWHPDGYPGNIAYSPELWEWMCKDLGFYLNWDPSHLTWIGIDPVETIAPFAEYIVHAQAKDLEIFPRKRNQYGFFGLVDKGDNPWDMGWWRFRIPGRGIVDWNRVVDRLYEVGFNGTLSVEHEDPMWGGTEPKVCEGLRIAYRELRPLIAEGEF